MNEQLRAKLLNTLVEHDMKMSTRKFYNPYALGQYVAALQTATAKVNDGASVRDALSECFNDRLLAKLLRVVA